MKRKRSAMNIIMENSHPQDVLSYEDIVKIVSVARRNRMDALVENIKDCMNPFKEKEATFDFSLTQEG